jgi:ankyrin repeat protein
MISNGANNWNGGFYWTCKRGHKDIVNLMIEKGANNWNEGLSIACNSLNTDMIHLMINKGADINSNINLSDSDLEYLVKADNSSFGKYTNRACIVRNNLTKCYTILDIKIISDLSRIIISY